MIFKRLANPLGETFVMRHVGSYPHIDQGLSGAPTGSYIDLSS